MAIFTIAAADEDYFLPVLTALTGRCIVLKRFILAFEQDGNAWMACFHCLAIDMGGFPHAPRA